MCWKSRIASTAGLVTTNFILLIRIDFVIIFFPKETDLWPSKSKCCHWVKPHKNKYMSFKSFVGFPANELNLIVLKSEKLLGKDLRRFLPLDIYWLAASAVMARLSVDSKIG